jgi:hypothetical protein
MVIGFLSTVGKTRHVIIRFEGIGIDSRGHWETAYRTNPPLIRLGDDAAGLFSF